MSSYSDFTIPPFKYFPTHLMEKEGPRHWAQLRFLQACERLNIPRHLWPEFKQMRLPRKYGISFLVKESYQVPEFHMLYESEAEWRERVHAGLEEILNRNAPIFRQSFQRRIEDGELTPVKPVRGTTPVALRYEWTARRYCMNEPYKAMSSEEYSPEQIRKTITRILAEIGLKQRT